MTERFESERRSDLADGATEREIGLDGVEGVSGVVACRRAACACLGIAYNTMMQLPRIVLDTNVLVAGLRSRRGASYRLLRLLGTRRFEVAISVPLVLEYEDVLMRHGRMVGFDEAEIAAAIDYMCAVGQRQRIHYLWRPLLRDPKDDLVLELAVAANCEGIVTFNARDFTGVEQFGLWVMPPSEFLARIGESG
jgi:putative PIN family toxin of toxin-antitoxin system